MRTVEGLFEGVAESASVVAHIVTAGKSGGRKLGVRPGTLSENVASLSLETGLEGVKDVKILSGQNGSWKAIAYEESNDASCGPALI